MAHVAIQVGDEFKVLNLSSLCAYGSFESRAEAEQAIADSAAADVLGRAEAA